MTLLLVAIPVLVLNAFIIPGCKNKDSKSETTISNNRAELEREVRKGLQQDSLFREYWQYMVTALSLDCSAKEQGEWFIENVPAGAEEAFRKRWNTINERLENGKSYEDIFTSLVAENLGFGLQLRQDLMKQNKIAPYKFQEWALAGNADSYNYDVLSIDDVDLFLSVLQEKGYSPFSNSDHQ